jgi:hypothetical protein
MQSEGRAFLGKDQYSVGSAFFTKRPGGDPDLGFEFYLTLTGKYLTPGLELKLAGEPKSGSAPSPHTLTRR